MDPKKLADETKALVNAAGDKLDRIRAMLTDDTRGLMEFCIILRLIHTSLPRMYEWANSDEFMTHIVLWTALGCPDMSSDTLPDDVLKQFKGKWVN
jgi:hypothetical protein